MPSKISEAKRPSYGTWLGTTIATLSVFGTILTLLGYGVAISAEATMGVPHQSLFATPVELLGLSVWAILQLITNVSESFHVWSNFVAIVKRLVPMFVMGYLLCAVGVAITHVKQFRRMSKRKFPEWVRKGAQFVKLDDGYLSDISRLAAVFLALLISVPFVLVVSSVVTIVLVVALSIFPAMGMSAGEAHIHRYVLGPSKCTPVVSREARLKEGERTGEPTATCLRVSNDRRSLGVGRLVLVTSSAVILFDPKSGAVWRAPTKDAVVETVGDIVPSLAPKRHAD